MTADSREAMDLTTTAAIEEKRKLRKHFGRFDIFFFFIAALITIDTIGQVASNGAQGFTWLVVLGLFFFIPYALVMAELGSTFPEEGGPYLWPRLAFGRLVGAVNSIIYWVAVPLWVGGSLVIVSLTAYGENFTPITGTGRYIYGLLFIWFAVAVAVVAFKFGKWIPNLGGWVRFAILGFFSLSVAIYALKHGLHGVSLHGFSPTYAAFIAVVPVLTFNYTGLELANAAGEEMKNPRRDVPIAILWSVISAVFLYGIPVLAILVVLPTGQVSGLSGFLDAAQAVFTVYGGHVTSSGAVVLTGAGLVIGKIATILFMLGLVTAGSTWLMGADRSQAVACFDGAGPRELGRFSAVTGTPIPVNILSGIASTITMLLAFQLAGNNPNKYFEAVLGLTISTTTVSLMVIFPSVIKLRYSHAHVSRPFRIPWGNAGAWICGVLTTFWCLLATIVLLWPGFGIGWFGSQGSASDALAALSFPNERLQYELTQILPLLVLVAVGLLFYVLGAPTRRQLVEVPISADAGASVDQ